jgi:hypothetical protein
MKYLVSKHLYLANKLDGLKSQNITDVYMLALVLVPLLRADPPAVCSAPTHHHHHAPLLSSARAPSLVITAQYRSVNSALTDAWIQSPGMNLPLCKHSMKAGENGL